MTTCNLGQEIRKTSSASAMPTYEELATRFRPIFKRIGEDALRREQTRELPFEGRIQAVQSKLKQLKSLVQDPAGVIEGVT
jgi:hypothetical protein